MWKALETCGQVANKILLTNIQPFKILCVYIYSFCSGFATLILHFSNLFKSPFPQCFFLNGYCVGIAVHQLFLFVCFNMHSVLCSCTGKYEQS